MAKPTGRKELKPHEKKDKNGKFVSLLDDKLLKKIKLWLSTYERASDFNKIPTNEEHKKNSTKNRLIGRIMVETGYHVTTCQRYYVQAKEALSKKT